MRTGFIIVWLMCVVHAQAQDPAAFDGHAWKAPYHLASPEGWGIERFLLPAGFAPEITYKGVEDIRFTPGWAKKGSVEYWSYVFLWYLDGQVKPDANEVATYLKFYYQGLVTINGANIPKDKIIPVQTSVQSVTPEGGDIATFQGRVTMTDYMTQQPITLYVKAHVLSCSGREKTFILHELSPQVPAHEVWKTMEVFRRDFGCKAR